MSIPEVSWLSLAAKRMDWAAARQTAVAGNIANADTPDYVGRDVVPFEDHLARTERARAAPETVALDTTWGASFDGNRIVLEEQVVAMNEAASAYGLAAKLYGKAYDMIGLAASDK